MNANIRHTVESPLIDGKTTDLNSHTIRSLKKAKIRRVGSNDDLHWDGKNPIRLFEDNRNENALDQTSVPKLSRSQKYWLAVGEQLGIWMFRIMNRINLF